MKLFVGPAFSLIGKMDYEPDKFLLANRVLAVHYILTSKRREVCYRFTVE